MPDRVIDDLLNTPRELESVLGYHVVAERVPAARLTASRELTSVGGETIDVARDGTTGVLDGRVQITFTDINAENGVIHVIDAVLVPRAFPGTIAEAVAASPRFSTLDTALAAAPGAARLLIEEDDLTYFALPNSAFAQLTNLPRLLAPENQGELTNLLLFHGIGTALPSSDIFDGLTIETLLAGNDVTFRQREDVVTVNGVPLTYVDIETANGVIHVPRSPLLPSP
jgi:uncharacterized surface protein with fasciclin (FAS1) repeats